MNSLEQVAEIDMPQSEYSKLQTARQRVEQDLDSSLSWSDGL